ncbi:glycosyl hydrolase 53 family protein [Flammeovirga kamogawensis]|uniref:Arabinogalactan endo-beta-1,4-galactanase n=1 Tax=Flammeovirga kamogawensis TaxID=373891 RepID=A0ABX8H0P4_9BACT|nr:glycosyl hydrolase 53 family protein [Flammeovirga kamogawensis]MBB6462349.1 arabinogalactan endo-1,4-beta-galactosidase [Flammeovirga kamogawensis]QWG09463.1 glycosyl hydrolase 53 family protein [Flammeovirga kamogawensis]TRX64979.1 T9SS type A sorting domain-containing protein [Flammeovirga kamogawensis]
MKTTTLLLIILFLSTFKMSAQVFYKGADLSYVNQLEDCGAVYYDEGISTDPFEIMANHGANLIRVRLWHNPMAHSEFPTNYSSFEDAVITITRAKNEGMHVLLDFHYSDSWADPGKQTIPAAWASLVDDTPALETKMYDYTYKVLTDLDAMGLMPEMVQVGNESNGQMLSAEGVNIKTVNWERQSALLKAGIAGVRAAGNVSSIQPQIVLHIANPAHGDDWFGNAISNGVTDFDIMGFSLYPEWHGGNVGQAGNTIEYLKEKYNKEVLLVEVGLPFTLDYNDTAPNMLSAMPSGYEVSATGQRDWLIDITTEVYNRGGMGVVYWEPAWVSTSCETEWGTGSHWENGAFFNFSNELILDGGIQFLEQQYVPDVINNVTFRVDMSAETGVTEAFITGDFTGTSEWEILPMIAQGDGIFTYTTTILEGTTGGYFFLKGSNWTERETVPTACALMWDNDRQYTITSGENIFSYAWQDCTPQLTREVTFQVDMTGTTASGAFITGDFTGETSWEILPMEHQGNNIYTYTTTLEIGETGAFYFLKENNWSDREIVPIECAIMWGVDRQYIVGNTNNTIELMWESCTNTSSARVIDESLETELSSQISLYPNPSKSFIKVKGVTQSNYQLYSLEGVTVLEGILENGNSSINIEQLPKGMYVLHLTKKGTQTSNVFRFLKD